jgi:quinol monooxygenase YgiN
MRIVAILEGKEGREGELEALLRGMIAASRMEPGKTRYDLWRDAGDASAVTPVDVA